MVGAVNNRVTAIESGQIAPGRDVRAFPVSVFRFSFYYYYYRSALAGGLPLPGGES